MPGGAPPRQNATALAGSSGPRRCARPASSAPSGTTADGGWSPPRGTPSSRSGSMSSSHRDRPMSKGASSCSATSRRGTAPLPGTGASATAAGVWGRSAAAASITGTPSTSTPPTSNANSAPIGGSAGATRRRRGSRPGVSTPSATGATRHWRPSIGCPIPCLSRPLEPMRRSAPARIGGAGCPTRSTPVLPLRRTGWRATPRRGSAAILTSSAILSRTSCPGARDGRRIRPSATACRWARSPPIRKARRNRR